MQSIPMDSVEDDLEEQVSREIAAPVSSPDLVPIVGANLRRLRVKRGLSLERLAKRSGVSRAMLSQVELGYSAPTINVIWRIAHALNVPFGALLSSPETETTHVLRKADTRTLASHDGSFQSRALFPYAPRHTEFYEVRLAGESVEHADAHAPGTMENLVVATGELIVRVNERGVRLRSGDAIQFVADVPHSYENPETSEVVFYLVMTYPDRIGE